MSETYFLDIPVYRVPQDRYYCEMESFIETRMYSGSAEHDEQIRQFHARNPEQKTAFADHLRDQYGGAWNYNEIIGYIQLHFLGSQIRGEYWQVKGRRIQRSRKKIFERRTFKLAPELDIPYQASNLQIYAIICLYLTNCAKELKGRYIDTTIFEAIGPHIDWLALYRNALP